MSEIRFQEKEYNTDSLDAGLWKKIINLLGNQKKDLYWLFVFMLLVAVLDVVFPYLNKIVNASVNQINDIKLIKKLNKFEELPDYLKEIANVRLEFPDVSLKELGQKLNPVLGKSGVNHRLKKLSSIAQNLREQNKEDN